METLGQRIKKCARERGLRDDDIARALGISKRAANSYSTDARQPPLANLITLADIFGVTTDYLLTGNTAPDFPIIDETGDVAAQVKAHQVAALSDDDFAQVQIYAAPLSAGAGAVPSESVIGNLAFRVEWLKREGISPAAASLHRIVGDSMPTSLPDGSIALANHRRRDARTKDIYALRVGDEVMVKWAELVSGTLVISSENPAYPVRVVTGSDLDQVNIIGRIQWCARVR